MSRHSLYSTFELLSIVGRYVLIIQIFIWDFETDFLCKILPNFDNLTRCHDSNDPLDGSKLPRGQGGVSILWPKLWKSNSQFQSPKENVLEYIIFYCLLPVTEEMMYLILHLQHYQLLYQP
jgi:hypothetical protein